MRRPAGLAPVLCSGQVDQIRESSHDAADDEEGGHQLRLRPLGSDPVSDGDGHDDQCDERQGKEGVPGDDVPQDAVLVGEDRDPEVGLVLQRPRTGDVKLGAGVESVGGIEEKENRADEQACGEYVPGAFPDSAPGSIVLPSS